MQREKKLWRQVATDLSRMVSIGHWPVGSIIPGEIELSKHYKVSRDTMRKAIEALVRVGMFERKPHVGTRVISSSRSQVLQHEFSSIRTLDDFGSKYRRTIQNTRIITLDEKLSELLGLAAGQEQFVFDNVRTDPDTGEVIVVTQVYVDPADRRVYEMAKSHPDELMFNLIEDIRGDICTEVRQIISATQMPEAAAVLLNVPAGVAALRIVRNYLNRRGETLTASISYHPSERYTFNYSFKLKPNASR